MTDWPTWNQSIEKRRAMSKPPPLPHSFKTHTDYAEWLAGMLHALGDYGKEAAQVLPMYASAIESLRQRIAELEARLAQLEKEPVPLSEREAELLDILQTLLPFAQYNLHGILTPRFNKVMSRARAAIAKETAHGIKENPNG